MMKMKEVAILILLQIIVANSFSPSSVSCRVGSKLIEQGGKGLHSIANAEAVNGREKLKETEKSAPFASFDYEAHWYPVSWEQDLVENEPTKVTVFDVDYVIAKTSEGVICMEDKCMHKAAALSEGRVSSNGKNFQCAYHGWSFDGKSGQCVEIPQLVKKDGSMGIIPSRTCAKAVPAQIHEQMVWIFPGGGLEKALQAPPPPSVPEVGSGKLKVMSFVRDFPVDWPILVSNIFDPDHGLFAHQAKSFDLYSASTEFPIEIDQEYPNDGKGWILKSKVESTDKVLEVDRKIRNIKKKKKADQNDNLWATSHFYAPFHLQLKRVVKGADTADFISTFYICPVGVGRSRFMAAFNSKMSLPRWIGKLSTDNFLDQDTYLLATQQRNILSQEARDIQLMLETDTPSTLQSKSMKTRRNMFCLTSPTERVGSRLELFWDATLLRVPNRIERLLQLNAIGAFATTPPREVVLDRATQQTAICKDSQGALQNCKRISKYSKLFGVATLIAKFMGKTPKALGSPIGLTSAVGLCFITSYLAGKMEKEFYYKYTDDYRKKDLAKIPDVWLDKD